jgi:Helix-turn-helix domain
MKVLKVIRLSEEEASEKLGVTKGTLANWRWRHYGPPYRKIGRRIEYLNTDIDDWCDAQRRDPSEQTAS